MDVRVLTVIGAGLVLTALAGPASAQAVEGERVRVRRVKLGPLDVDALRAQDAAASTHPGTRRRRIGLRRRFPTIRAPRILRPGRRVAVAPDGSYVWTCEVDAPGALGLRLHVRRCRLPDGAELFAYDADEPAERYGPWTGRGPGGAGAFYTPTVFGERIRLELRVAPDAVAAPLRLAVGAVAQRYAELAPAPDDETVVGGGAAVAAKRAGACNRTLACERDYAVDIGRAVGYVEFLDGRYFYNCSGVLLDDADPAGLVPWFLTANHCISTEASAASVECFWDYRALECDGEAPRIPTLARTLGAKLVVTHPGTDVTLLQLTGSVPGDRFYAPWSADPLPPGAAVASVHFPKGSHARISFGNVGMQTTNFDSVTWSVGTTQPGSSGAPLFNARREVVGQLYGGTAYCSNPQGTDEYGRLATSYELVAKYLDTVPDPPPPVGQRLDAADPLDDEPPGATEAGRPGLVAADLGVRRVSDGDAADWYVFDLVRRGRYVFRSTGDQDVRAWLYDTPLADVPLAFNDDGSGDLQFRIEHRTRTSSRVWLRVEAYPAKAFREYGVEAFTITQPAAAVKKLRATARRNGKVLLRWRDKARGEASYAVEIDVGSTGNWQRLVDLRRNARRFVHDPGPGAGTHRYRVGPFNAAGITWTEIELAIDGE